jgi:hypothetical protein
MNGERVHAAGEFPGKRRIYHAMALDPGLTFERVSHNINSEVGLPAFPMSGMAFVLVRFILHLEALGRESLGQLIRDDIGGSHAARVKRRRRAGQWQESRRIGAVVLLSSLEGIVRKGA